MHFWTLIRCGRWNPTVTNPKFEKRGFFFFSFLGGGGGGVCLGLFRRRNNLCDIHAFIVQAISITRFCGRRMNGNKKNFGLPPYCGQFHCCPSVCSAESRKSNMVVAEDEQKTSYEFILGGGGGGWFRASWLTFLPSFQPLLCPLSSTRTNLNTRTRFTKPQKKEDFKSGMYNTHLGLFLFLFF